MGPVNISSEQYPMGSGLEVLWSTDHPETSPEQNEVRTWSLPTLFGSLKPYGPQPFEPFMHLAGRGDA